MKSATEVAAKHVDGRIPVVAGTGTRTTTECIALSEACSRTSVATR